MRFIKGEIYIFLISFNRSFLRSLLIAARHGNVGRSCISEFQISWKLRKVAGANKVDPTYSKRIQKALDCGWLTC